MSNSGFRVQWPYTVDGLAGNFKSCVSAYIGGNAVNTQLGQTFFAKGEDIGALSHSSVECLCNSIVVAPSAAAAPDSVISLPCPYHIMHGEQGRMGRAQTAPARTGSHLPGAR